MKRRGMAYLMAILLLMGMVTVFGVVVSFGANMIGRQTGYESYYVAREAAASAFDLIKADVAAGRKTLPYSASGLTLGDVTLSYSVARLTSIGNAMTATVNCVLRGKTYTFDRTMGTGLASIPSFYALATKNAFSATQNLTTTNDGAIGSNGAVSLNGTGTINGDVEAAGSLTVSSNTTVTGKSQNSMSNIPFPTVTGNDYDSAKTLGLSGGTWSALLFVGGPPYNLLYVNGNLTLNTLTVIGRGTVYVKGNLIVAGNLTYSSTGGPEVVFVVEGTITFQAACRAAVGHYYATSTISVAGGSAFVLNGSLVAEGQINLSAPTTINFDDSLWKDPTYAKQLKLPGIWP